MFRFNKKPVTLVAQAIRGGGGVTNKQSLNEFEPQEESKEKLSHPTESGVETKRSFKDFCGRIMNRYFERLKGAVEIRKKEMLNCEQTTQKHNALCFSMTKRYKICAFTLAEVLVTLSILGVVAAVTIPSIHRSFEDRMQITGVKTAYALFSNAFSRMVAVEGPFNKWDWPSSGQTDYLNEKLSKYLAYQKYCGTSNGCFSYGHYKSGFTRFKSCGNASFFYGDWTEANKSGKALLKNGMTAYITVGTYPRGQTLYCHGIRLANDDTFNPLCGRVGNITVDVNGKKGPNRIGYDVHTFIFYSNGDVYPYNSMKNDKVSRCEYCTETGYGACVNNDNNNTYINTCTSWVLQHDNMDYKRKNVSAQWPWP